MIVLISKELECVSLKNDFASHSYHTSIALSPNDTNCVSHACSTSSSSIDNDICILKKSVDCLASTLNQCAMNHTMLEFKFRKKHTPHLHAHPSRHTHALMFTHMTPCMLECTLVHIAVLRATL